MACLLVVHHSPGRRVGTLLDAVLAGAGELGGEGVEVRAVEALAVQPDDVLAADGFVLVGTANFGYMSGALKHFFDTHFPALGGALDADGAPSSAHRGPKLPWGLVLAGRHDLVGALRSVESIAGALPWRRAASPVLALGELSPAHVESAHDLGGVVAALVAENADRGAL